MSAFFNFIYLLGLALWIGEVFFFASVGGPAIFKTLERQLAGDVVTAVFPKYYLLGAICGGGALLSAVALWTISISTPSWFNILRTALLVVMLGLWLYSGYVLRPQAHEVRTELRTLAEGSPGHSELSARFGSMHKRSVMINGTVLILGIALVFFTGYNYRD
ncbi:MAG: DUF4149 domain-containing protein [Candidatus Dadabacteria bacterium]|nr:DUF4149 domain-containing protein [Candidatus Dadabacteria bacterium]